MLFVVPGTCYELLRNRTKLPREESAFQQVSRVLLAGSVISVGVSLTLAGIGVCAPGSLLNVSKLLTGGTGYVAANVGMLGWTVTLFLSFSLLFAVALVDLRTAEGTSVIHQADAWHLLAKRLPILEMGGPHVVVVSVRLKSGRDVVGHYFGSSTELEHSKRELHLQAPLYAREVDQDQKELLGEEWAVMSIIGSEIESVAFNYSPFEGAGSRARAGVHWTVVDWFAAHWKDWQVATSAAVFVVLIALVVG